MVVLPEWLAIGLPELERLFDSSMYMASVWLNLLTLNIPAV